jgi:hypothetical protein
MRRTLIRHCDASSPARGVEAEAVRSGDGLLLLQYCLHGLADCLLPPAAAVRRADELWRYTCFEAFVRTGGDAYCEFNFSPSRAWAAYRFDAYRQGMRPATVPEPRLEWRILEDRLDFSAHLDLTTALPQETPWRLNLAAVIEAKDGTLSYWALRHPPGKPDFHHPDCFALELVPTSERNPISMKRFSGI